MNAAQTQKPVLKSKAVRELKNLRTNQSKNARETQRCCRGCCHRCCRWRT